VPVKVREWIGPALAAPDFVLDAQRRFGLRGERGGQRAVELGSKKPPQRILGGEPRAPDFLAASVSSTDQGGGERQLKTGETVDAICSKSPSTAGRPT
jgi:hypothetical protein